MKRKTLNAWIEALESGKYRQATGQLKERNTKNRHVKHCCLGVLCEVIGVELVRPEWSETDFAIKEPSASKNNGEFSFETASLTNKVLADVGLSEDIQSQLITLNDEDRYSFKKIAKWLREHRKDLESI